MDSLEMAELESKKANHSTEYSPVFMQDVEDVFLG